MRPRAPFLKSLTLKGSGAGYAREIPAIRDLGRLVFDERVTFFAGENASGKSTLVEAIAVAAKLNPEGGGRLQWFNFTTRASHSELHRAIDLERSAVPPVNAFFLRAESFFNYATAAEGATMEDVYERPLHEQSHGESFLALVRERFAPAGLYILDEPEAALSVRGQLALMRRMHELVERDSQFIVATHSPILLGFPGALIYELGDAGTRRIEYEETAAYALTKSFLDDRDRFFHYLFADE